jgi:hypothetical protein
MGRSIVSQIDPPSVLVHELNGGFQVDTFPFRNPVSDDACQFQHIAGASGLRGADSVRATPRKPRASNLQFNAISIRQIRFSSPPYGIQKERIGRARRSLFTLATTRGVLGRRRGSPITHQLKTSTYHHPSIEIEIDPSPPSPAIGQLDSLDRTARSNELHPVQRRRKSHMAARCRVHGASYRRTGIHQVFGSGQTGPFRSAAQLCQVGTPTSNRSIQIQLPKSEATTEIEDRHPEAPIRCHEPAPGTQHQPRLAVGGKHVDDPLKPASTATSDEQVRLSTDAQRRPGSQIYSLVDLGLTILPDTSEVLFEIWRTVHHGKTTRLKSGTPFAC